MGDCARGHRVCASASLGAERIARVGNRVVGRSDPRPEMGVGGRRTGAGFAGHSSADHRFARRHRAGHAWHARHGSLVASHDPGANERWLLLAGLAAGGALAIDVWAACLWCAAIAATRSWAPGRQPEQRQFLWRGRLGKQHGRGRGVLVSRAVDDFSPCNIANDGAGPHALGRARFRGRGFVGGPSRAAVGSQAPRTRPDGGGGLGLRTSWDNWNTTAGYCWLRFRRPASRRFGHGWK